MNSVLYGRLFAPRNEATVGSQRSVDVAMQFGLMLLRRRFLHLRAQTGPSGPATVTANSKHCHGGPRKAEVQEKRSQVVGLTP
jgi:hypothetical protein